MNRCPSAAQPYGFFHVDNLEGLYPAMSAVVNNPGIAPLYIRFVEKGIYDNLKSCIDGLDMERFNKLAGKFIELKQRMPTDEGTLYAMYSDVPFMMRMMAYLEQTGTELMRSLNGWDDIYYIFRHLNEAGKSRFSVAPEYVLISTTDAVSDAARLTSRINNRSEVAASLRNVERQFFYLTERIVERQSLPLERPENFGYRVETAFEAAEAAIVELTKNVSEAYEFITKEFLKNDC